MNASIHARRTTSGSSHDRHRPTAPSSSNHIPEDDIPHAPGSPDCLCSACHLSRDIFPRRQDGKIELPYPWLMNSQLKSGGRPPKAAHQEELIRRSRSNVELRENAWRGYGQLSGPGVPANPITESILTIPPSIRTFKMPASDMGSDLVKRERSQTPAIEQASGHADRSRQSKKKTSQSRTKRPEPWPRFTNTPVSNSRSSSRTIGHSDPELANPYSEISSHSSLAPSGTSGQPSWPDPYKAIVEETFPQLFDSRMGLGKRELNLSGISSTISQTISISSTQDNGQIDTSSTATSTSHKSEQQSHNSASSRSVSLPERYDQIMLPPMERVPSSSMPRDGDSIVDPPRVIRFNSCHNPQPDTWVSRNNVDEAAQGCSEIRLSPEQTHTGILRFQDPLIPESYPSTMTGSREPSAFQLRWDSEEEKGKKDKSPFRHSTYPSTATGSKATSVVQVKWDSERKRRQGYFAQEGEEKSPFRHYNKSNDFDDQRGKS